MGPPSASECRCLKATASEGKLQSSVSFVARGLHKSGAHSPHLPVGAGQLSAPTPPFRLLATRQPCPCLSLAAGGHPFPPGLGLRWLPGLWVEGKTPKRPLCADCCTHISLLFFDMTKKIQIFKLLLLLLVDNLMSRVPWALRSRTPARFLFFECSSSLGPHSARKLRQVFL